MSFTLYPHQAQLVADIQMSLHINTHIIACAATGMGKSKIAITICNAALTKGRSVLVITESDKIYKQFDAEIPHTININANTTLTHIQPNKLYLAMAQTLSRRPKLIAQFAAMQKGLIIINDECHIGTSTKLLLQLHTSYLIGLTATPAMRWAKHLPKLYKDITIGAQPEWLVSNGYLTPYTHEQKFPVGLQLLQIGNNGEYTEASQETVFDAVGATDHLVDSIRSAKYHKAMIFCASIKSAETLYTRLKHAGIACIVQHSNYSLRPHEEQKTDLIQYHDVNSTTNICISVASMNKGYDFPAIDWIILWRATTSLPLYLQMMGRASRIYQNKTEWKVTDWGANGRRFGRWDAERDWATLWNTIPKKKDGIAAIKECPECHYLLPPTAKICPECNHIFKAKKVVKTAEGIETIMLEKKNKTLERLKNKFLSELTAEELAEWAIATDNKKHANRIAQAQGQVTQSYLYDYAAALGYTRGWAWRQLQQMPHEKISYFDKIIR